MIMNSPLRKHGVKPLFEIFTVNVYVQTELPIRKFPEAGRWLFIVIFWAKKKEHEKRTTPNDLVMGPIIGPDFL